MERDIMNPQLIKKLSKRFSGKLLLRNEIPIDPPVFDKLLQTNYFKRNPSIVKSKWKILCVRCNNQTPHKFAQYPCLLCKTPHYYCRKCITMGRVSECESLYEWTGPSYPALKHQDPCSWRGRLTSHQQLAANNIVSAIEGGANQHLIWAVCGSGKTEMLFPGITRALQLGKRLCIATPRSDVVRELLPRLKQAFEKVSIQGLYGGSKDKEATAQIIISTTHQLLRYKRAFDVIIIDEVDAFPYHADSSLPFATRRALACPGTMIYLTATPRKEQKREIQGKKLPHTFVPRRYHNHPLPVPTFKFVFNLSKQLNSKGTLNFLQNWLKLRRNPNRQILIFVPTIRLAELLIEPLTKLFLTSRTITTVNEIKSVHPEDSQRSESILKYRKRKIKILITTTILERGVTFPSVDVLVINSGHSVFDEASLVQIAGRAGRSADDPEGEVIFFHEGKTKAMIRARKLIINMNKRAGFR